MTKSAVVAVRVTCAVPEPVKVPAPEMTSPAAGVKTLEVPKVIVPATAKPPPEEVTVAPEAIAKLLKVIAVALEFTIELLLFIVIVPPVGAKVTPEFTVKAPPTLKLAEGWVVGVAATVKPENFIVPGEVAIVKVVALIVIVPPPDASKVEFEGIVKVLAKLKLDELVTLEEVVNVKL